MENPDFINDEVIADSEEENDPNMSMDRSMGFLGHGVNPTSSVSAFTTIGYPQVKPFSAISEFTGDTPVRPGYGDHLPEDISGGSNQRGPGQADTSVSSINNTFPDFEGMSVGNIADRAKMRQRTQKRTLVDPSDVIELSSSDEDDEMRIKPSTSKTKPAPKPKPKPKAQQKAKEISSEDIESPGVSTKASLPPKPRPRPVPIRKRAKTPQDVVPAASTPGPELPIATSPPRNPPPNQRITSYIDSELPPSDPPMSTFRTEYSKENEAAFPRIETLPKSVPGGPLSSPSSLFSDGGAGTTRKKSHGRSADSDAEIDELAPSEEGPVGYYHSERSLLLQKMPPPPTFFAGSSSLPTDGEGEGTDILPAELVSRPDIVDLTDLPPTMAPTTKSKSSPKKKLKKKQASSYEEYDDITAPIVILDEDEQDDDFDPSGDGEKKKKGKAKGKEKKGKTKKTKEPTKTRPEGAQVEVLITTKPPKSKTKKKEKSDAKTKDKEKELVKGADKEVFKSREFIEESDEDDPLQLVEGSSAVFDAHLSSGSAAQDKDTASSSSAKLTITIPVAQPPSALPLEPSSPLSDLDMPKPKPSKSKSATGSKKRKSIVDSDHDEELEEIQKNDTPSKSKKRKTDGSAQKKEKSASSRKGKAKQIVLSEEEEESFDMDAEKDEPQVQHKDPEKKKSSKMIVDEEDGNQSDDMDPEVDQQERISKPRDVDKSTKENTAPPMSKPPVVATPKPSKPIPINNDGTTPLYARYEIAPRRSSLPMSELIRRANSMPGSPFSTPNTSSASASASTSMSKSSKLKPLLARTPSSTAYSPYLKSSRSLLSKIAPLHPNRKTPPPPPPPPPPRKKSKKELELEAKWEEEMVEDAGGMEAWAALQDDERKEMRKMKWARELGGWDD